MFRNLLNRIFGEPTVDHALADFHKAKAKLVAAINHHSDAASQKEGEAAVLASEAKTHRGEVGRAKGVIEKLEALIG